MRIIGLSIFLFSFNQTAAQIVWPLQDWRSSTAVEQKMDAKVLKEFDMEIANGKFGNVDEMLVTRNGTIVIQKKYPHNYEELFGEKAKNVSGLNHFPMGGPFNYYDEWWHPFYHKGDLHTLQSVTKTVVSAIIGVAVYQNEFPDLSTPVLHFFDTTLVKNIDERKRKMNLRHLLTMTTGLNWEEWNSVEDPGNDCFVMEGTYDWVQYVIDKPMIAEPGQRFKYNSGASQLLSYIFKKATGKDIEEYAARHLFEALGITDFYWKRTPTGLADTEGGLYLRATDLAKIGYMYLRNGAWNGTRLISSNWINSSVTPGASVNANIKYGYKWWLIRYGTENIKYAWCGRGFGDQALIIIPEYDIVAVFTGWNITEGGTFLRTEEMIKKIVNAVSVN